VWGGRINFSIFYMETLLPRRTSFSTAGKTLSGGEKRNPVPLSATHGSMGSMGSLSLSGMAGSSGNYGQLGRHSSSSHGLSSSSRISTPGDIRGSASGSGRQPETIQEEELALPPSNAYLYPKKDTYRFLEGKRPVRPVGAGLKNMGNTCYLNSVLQALTYTAPFSAYLLSKEHELQCDLNRQGTTACMTCIFEKHVQEVFSSRTAVTPRNLLQRLKLISKNLQVGRQEDAHEFLRAFLDACHRSFIPERGKKDKLPDAIANTTLIHQIFGGYLRSQVKCSSCNFCSNTYDPFLDLSLEMQNCTSLQQALRQFTVEETLSGSNKYKCTKCKKSVCAQKQFLIHKVPKVLTIQLKRFNFGIMTNGEKVNKPISFPFDLELGSYTSNPNKPASYRLYALTVHSGASMKSGHYFTYGRNMGSNLWYRFDDESVSQVSQDIVARAQAYLLYYEMKEPCMSSPRRY